MATPEKIVEAGKGIAGKLSEIPGIRVRPYQVTVDQLDTGDGTLTLASSGDAAGMGRSSAQPVVWDLQIQIDSDVSSDGTKVEREIASLIAADNDDSLFGKLRELRHSEVKHGSPVIAELEVGAAQKGVAVVTIIQCSIQAVL